MNENTLSRQRVRPARCIYYDDLPLFRHTHEYARLWLVFCILRGEMHYSIDNSGEYVLRSGEILICPPYCQLSKATAGPLSICMLNYENDLENLPDMQRPILGSTVFSMNERIRQDLALIAQTPADSAYRSVLQMDIWHQLCQMYQEPLIPVQEKRREGSIAQALDYIAASLHQKLTLEMLAEKTGYSPAMLIQKFKYYTGSTPMQYITGLRMDRAKSLLLDRRKTLREVAAACGFANEFYLSTVFRRCTGLSPSEYRRSSP